MRQSDEVETVTAVVGDLDKHAVVVSLDDGSGRAGRPAPRIGAKRNDIEHMVSKLGHHDRVWQRFTECPPK